jgi:hypothetical protein
MLDLKLLLMYTRVFRRRLIVTIALSLVVQVFVYTTLLHYLWPPSPSTSSSSPPVAGGRPAP